MRDIKRRLSAVLLFIILFTFSSCFKDKAQLPESAMENEPEEDMLVLEVGILNNNYNGSKFHYSDMTGGVWTQCNKQELTKLLHSDSLGLKKIDHCNENLNFNCEIVSVYSKNEYFSSVQSGNDLWEYEFEIPLALLYSFQSKTVYCVKDRELYIIENPEPIRLFVSQCFSASDIFSDTKLFWPKNDLQYDVFIQERENSFYSVSLNFRYERYWCEKGDVQESDFVDLEGYSANNLEDMLTSATEILGTEEFSAYLAEDVLTGYWRCEFCNLNDESQKYLIYFDDQFDILFGFLVN